MSELINKKKNISAKTIKEFAGKYAIYLVLLVLLLSIGFLDSSFLSKRNIINILIIASVRVIIALGVGGALITRGTDLSAGRVVGFTACISASLLQRPDYAYKLFKNAPQLHLIVPILLVLIVGLLIGAINGLVVAYLKVPPFIATLGMMVIVYGAACIYTNAQPIGGLRKDFSELGTGSTLGIPNLIIIAALVILIMWFILNKTKFGKHIYAIAAATIGGVSTSGGIGTVQGIITGVLIFEVLNNGLVILGVSAYWQQVIKGIIIIGAVAFDIRKYIAKK